MVNRHIRNDWLWDRVRVLGGAYGCFSGIDLKTNVMSFVSYRDPNVKDTFEVYEGTGEFLRTTPLKGEELANCVIGTMGDLDPCQLPDAKGYGSMLRYISGLTDTRRQEIRDEVLATTTRRFPPLCRGPECGEGEGALCGARFRVTCLRRARTCFPGDVVTTPIL